MNKQLEQVSRVTTECMSFIWKIENFPSLQVKTGEFVRSSLVQCSNSCLCLKLFPNGEHKSDQVEIYLEHVGGTSSSRLPSGLGYRIGLKNRSGENCFKLLSAADPPSTSNEDKFLSSANDSLESVHTTVTTHASSTSGAPHASLTNTFNGLDSLGFSCAFDNPLPFRCNFVPVTTTRVNSNVKSSSFVSGYSNPVRTTAKDSLPRSAPSSDKLVNNIQPQSLVLSHISTKEPNFRFSNEKEKTNCFTFTSKNVCFLDASKGMVLSRKLLFEMTEDLLPNDVLTVVCEMEINIVAKVSESTLVKENTSNDGTKSLIENLQNAFENPRFSDVTLKVGDVQFPAHKIILANRSKVFDAMFDSEMKESQENVVDLVEMKPSIAKDMLSYVYTGHIRELSMDRATDLFVAADRYDMPELKQWCKDFIVKHISPDYACDVAILANLHGDEDLSKASKHTIKNNLKAVLNSTKWLSLSKKSPAVYLELLQVALLEESN